MQVAHFIEMREWTDSVLLTRELSQHRNSCQLKCRITQSARRFRLQTKQFADGLHLFAAALDTDPSNTYIYVHRSVSASPRNTRTKGGGEVKRAAARASSLVLDRSRTSPPAQEADLAQLTSAERSSLLPRPRLSAPPSTTDEPKPPCPGPAPAPARGRPPLRERE